MPKQRYLTTYDYGMGSIIAYIYANSPAEITARFPELKVINERRFFSVQRPESVDELRRMIETHHTYDLDDTPKGLLQELLKHRVRKTQP